MKKLITLLLIVTLAYACTPSEKNTKKEETPTAEKIESKPEEKPIVTNAPQEKEIFLKFSLNKKQTLTNGLYKEYTAIFEKNYENSGGNMLLLKHPKTNESILFIDSDNSGHIGTNRNDRYIHKDANGFIIMDYTHAQAIEVRNEKIAPINSFNAMLSTNVDYQSILEQLEE